MIETDCPYCSLTTTAEGYKFVETKFESVKKEKFTLGKLVKFLEF